MLNVVSPIINHNAPWFKPTILGSFGDGLYYIQLMLMHFSWGWLPHRQNPPRSEIGAARERPPIEYQDGKCQRFLDVKHGFLSSKLQTNVKSVVELPATMEVQTNRKGLVLFNSLADSVFDLRDSPGQASPTWILWCIVYRCTSYVYDNHDK